MRELARETDGEFVTRREWQYCPWINLDVPTNLRFLVLPQSALETRFFTAPHLVREGSGGDPEAPVRAELPQGDTSPVPEDPRVQ